ncbi:MAG: DUF6584 family protein [Planctomycetaceae bacterium]
MSKDSTLKRIESEIAAGDLGKGRDRLHGLISSYPNDLTLRSRLAEVYWKLQYPHRAGCYWFLEEHQTHETREAVAAFEKRCGGDPWIILHSIKFRGDPDHLSPLARERLEGVIARCKAKYGRYPDFSQKRTRYIETAQQKATTTLLATGCITALVLIGACAIVGLITIVSWLLTIS